MPGEQELPHAVWSGTFMIGDFEMRCHVLSTGERIIEAECVEQLLTGGTHMTPDDLADFARWLKEPNHG